MQVTLKNGTKIEGTRTDIARILQTLGEPFADDGIHYNSSTKGLVPIATMNTVHVKNSIRKIYRGWVNQLDTRGTNRDFLGHLRRGPGAGNITLLALINELKGRPELP